MPPPGFFPTRADLGEPCPHRLSPCLPLPRPTHTLGSGSSCGLYETEEQKGRAIPLTHKLQGSASARGERKLICRSPGRRRPCPDMPAENQVPSAVSQAGESPPARTEICHRPSERDARGPTLTHRGKGTLHGQGRGICLEVSKEMS